MTGRREFWRGLLILGRVSNLPTVWSNCFAGWLLGGGGSRWILFELCAGATLIYVGGMFLNDAIDADFDRQHRRERPVPSGQVSLAAAWWFALVLLGAGSLLLIPLGWTTGCLTLLLLVTVVVYDVVHKRVAFAPFIMAGCRFWLFLVAASAGANGVAGYSVWCAFALGAYVVGLSFIARHESLNSPVALWPALALVAPVLLAQLINNADHRMYGLALSAVLVGWMIYCVRPTFWSAERNLVRTVAGLLAGIVLVDLLAVGWQDYGSTLVFFGLFALALVFQRFVPAT